jgi:DNA-binding NtrC family response regulator
MNDCKILIIDDDTDDVEILAEAFTQCGVDGVHHVNSAMKAFIYLQQVESSCLPKLIISDLHLPGITGEQFLKDLKGMDKYKHIPVVLTATVKPLREIDTFHEMGAVDFIIKPETYQEYMDVAAEMKRKAEL